MKFVLLAFRVLVVAAVVVAVVQTNFTETNINQQLNWSIFKSFSNTLDCLVNLTFLLFILHGFIVHDCS